MNAHDGRDRRGIGAANSRPAQQPGPAAGNAPENAGTPSATDAPPANSPESTPLPAISLPKGGGALHGMGEKVAVNAANGTAGATVPLPLSPGRGGFGPKLALGYSSGAGNGPFGFGWSLDTPAITRKTDKGLPRYADGEESDVFILSGAEDLVAVLDATGARQSLSRTVWGKGYLIHFYRPRIEGLYAKIERWTEVATGLSHWRSISRDNVSTLYGYDAASRVSDPADPTHVFAWHISRSWDSRGNLMVNDYIREDGAGIDMTSAHEANRSPAARAAQIYLKAIRWTGDSPYLPDWTAATEPALPANWAMQAVIDYGDHRASPPTPTPDQPWLVRPDPFSTRRSGFELRTYRRARRVLMFHSFPGEASAGSDLLVSSLDLTFSDEVAPADPRNPVYTFIASATHTGYRRDGAARISRSLPVLEFDYSTPVIGSEVLALDRDSLANFPEGIDGGRFRWLDLDGEGTPGILSFDEGAWWYKRNQSAANLVPGEAGTLLARAKFAEAEPVARIPARSGPKGQQFLDLAGEGRQDLVALAEPEAGFYRRSEDEDFEPLKRFGKLPAIDWNDPNLRFIDLTGDGLADVLITEDGVFTYHQSLGTVGFALAQLVRTPWDEEQGPKLVLADGTGTIFIADMTGDGLNDLVRVRNGEACYWPNLGYGRFGAKVTMDGAPRFAAEQLFEPRRIRLADIDGSGSADIVYVDNGGVRVWFNQSGNTWSAQNTIAVFPSADLLSSVQVIDLLGTGTACLVWSSPLPGPRAPLLYVDLMSGQKPHLLVAMRNNLGAETRISYAPSTRFYLTDQAAGTPWVTRLPFPVQVVERCEVIDWIGRNRLVSRYSYHHGYFDGYEREFRGFRPRRPARYRGIARRYRLSRWRRGQFRRGKLLAAGADPQLVPYRRLPAGAGGQPAICGGILGRAWALRRRCRGHGAGGHAAAGRTRRLRGAGGLSCAQGPGGPGGSLCRGRFSRRRQSLFGGRNQFHPDLPATSGAEPARGLRRHAAREPDLPIRADRGRSAHRS